MRILGTLIVAALILAACSSSPSASTPSVAIDSVDVSGDRVSVVVTVGEGGPVVLTVDWGDGTSEPDVRGTGTFAFEHSFGADVTSATISARATAADGLVASDVAAVEVNGGASTTSLAALATTTTATVVTTTTTLPPTTTTSTTTTVPPTTTTSTTTTVPPTTTTTQPPPTTTTIPQPVVVEAELDISKGVILDRWGGGVNESTWNGKTATATVTRHNDSWESDGIAVSFAIPTSLYEDMKQGASLLVFDFIAYPLATYTLETDLLDGNAAEVRWEFMGTYDTTWSPKAKKVDIDSGFLTEGKSGETFEGSWTVGPTQFGTPQKVHMFFECKAKGPGGIIVGSNSHCDASLAVNGIGVTIVAHP